MKTNEVSLRLNENSKYIHDMKSLNGVNCIYDNKVNNIDKYNLLHDILNPSKHTKNISIHYYPILHGCINTRKGKVKFKNYQI